MNWWNSLSGFWLRQTFFFPVFLLESFAYSMFLIGSNGFHFRKKNISASKTDVEGGKTIILVSLISRCLHFWGHITKLSQAQDSALLDGLVSLNVTESSQPGKFIYLLHLIIK